MNQMLLVAKEIFKNWSRTRDQAKEHAIAYANETTITISDWTAAYQWYRLNIKNLLQRGDFFYTMSTTIKKNITKVTCNLKLNWIMKSLIITNKKPLRFIGFILINWIGETVNVIVLIFWKTINVLMF